MFFYPINSLRVSSRRVVAARQPHPSPDPGGHTRTRCIRRPRVQGPVVLFRSLCVQGLVIVGHVGAFHRAVLAQLDEGVRRGSKVAESKSTYPVPFQQRCRTLPIILSLPFRGTWVVTQGWNGKETHRDVWRHGRDFEVTDEKGKTCCNSCEQLTDYSCYNLPVLQDAPDNGRLLYEGDDLGCIMPGCGLCSR